MRNYESLKIMLFCQKREENNNPTKYSHCFTQSLGEKRRATVNLLCVKKRKFMQKRMRKSRFSLNCLLGQKQADMFRFALFQQSSVRNYKLLKISLFGKNVKKTTTWQKLRTVSPQPYGKKLRPNINLHKLP